MSLTELIAQLQAIEAVEGGAIEAVMHDREWGEYWTIKQVAAESVMHAGEGTYQRCKGKKPHTRVLLLDA